jgi:hypothetical protein
MVVWNSELLVLEKQAKMTPLVTLGAPLAALAIATPPVARAVAATPAVTTEVRRAFLAFFVSDMAVSLRFR